jgi:hypothetical protein
MTAPISNTTKPVPGSPLAPELSEHLTGLGFDPRWPLYLHADAYDGLSLDGLRSAVFDSQYTNPRPLMLQAELPEPDEDIAYLPMLVEFVQIVYVARPGKEFYSEPLRVTEFPHYYLRGWLYSNSHDRRGPGPRMHAYVETYTTEAIKSIIFQVAPPSVTDDESKSLRWADRPPGRLTTE